METKKENLVKKESILEALTLRRSYLEQMQTLQLGSGNCSQANIEFFRTKAVGWCVDKDQNKHVILDLEQEGIKKIWLTYLGPRGQELMLKDLPQLFLK